MGPNHRLLCISAVRAASQRLSLFSCFASLTSAPIIVALDNSAGTSLGGKLSIAAMLASFGMFTTGEPLRLRAQFLSLHQA